MEEKKPEIVESTEVVKGKDREKNREDDHVVYIGGKPFMNYVTGVVMQFTTQNADEVVVKSRGRFISRAVDVCEVATKRFLNGQIKIADNGVKVDSEEFENKEGNKVRVSTVEIKLVKQ